MTSYQIEFRPTRSTEEWQKSRHINESFEEISKKAHWFAVNTPNWEYRIIMYEG